MTENLPTLEPAVTQISLPFKLGFTYAAFTPKSEKEVCVKKFVCF